MKAELKNRATGASVSKFIASVKDGNVRRDCRELLKIMEGVAGARARMWGPSMVGFGSYHYRYASGREGDWFIIGFSPRKNTLSIYISAGFGGMEKELRKLGPHSTGRSCLYVRTLEDIDRKVLAGLLSAGVKKMQ